MRVTISPQSKPPPLKLSAGHVRILSVLSYVSKMHNKPTVQSPSHSWFSWPISICLHQSYPLTRGLDSSMPATPRPPCPQPSLHLSLHPCLFTSGIQCCHCALKWCSTASNAPWMRHIKRGATLGFSSILCQKYHYKTTIFWRTVILPSLALQRFFFLTLWFLYMASKW